MSSLTIAATISMHIMVGVYRAFILVECDVAAAVNGCDDDDGDDGDNDNNNGDNDDGDDGDNAAAADDDDDTPDK